MCGKAIVKIVKAKDHVILGIVAILSFLPVATAWAEATGTVPESEAQGAPKSELDSLKAEWEAVREQQIQMIREKEDQLEKLKEEIFAKMKTLNLPAAPQSTVPPSQAPEVPGPILPADPSDDMASLSAPALEAQKAAFQAERQKFFSEMSRQRESLRRLQSSLEEKSRQLATERERFELEKRKVVS